jgi:NRPS condensation-like uncharacterized protein
MSKKAYDPISPWFIAAEALGEFIGIRFGRIAPGKGEPEWIFFRHADFDGIGGFAEILREKGVPLGQLPQIKHSVAPSLLPLVRIMPKFLLPHQRVKWKPLERDGTTSSHSEPPPAVAWHVFDEATTLRVRQFCRHAGVTVNSFLLKHLTKAIRPHLENQSSKVPWMIPVNLRGPVVRDRDTANYSSYVSVKVQPDETVQDVHRNIYAALERKEHWANWHAYELGRFTTHGMRKFLIAKELATSQWNLGGFSNLGDWDPEKKITRPACLGDWLFCPPVLRFQRIGAGCVTFQNRLSLLIQAHPELTTNSAIPRTWIQNWIKEIVMDLSRELPQPATLFGQRPAN